MAVNLKKPTSAEKQAVNDAEFVVIVGHLTDLGFLAEKIVSAHGGWDN